MTMRAALCFLLLASSALAADVVEPKDCASFPCLIFNDEFDFLDHEVWEHEINLSGGGNEEFQVYVNNRSISYTRDSTLFIRPDLTSNWHSEDFLTSGNLNLWGMNGRGHVCTGNAYQGCERTGDPVNIINPIISARIRTLSDFSFKYGRLEVRAKMPSGDWLFPAIWLLPRYWPYGFWPASGEIDIVEARGNDDYSNLGNQYAETTLNWGPSRQIVIYERTHSVYSTSNGTFANSFHTWRMDWTKDNMQFYVDDELQMLVDPGTSFWDFGELDNSLDNPWKSGSKMAPFDQKFYLLINLAVGDTAGFFPDDVPSDPPKPWSDTSSQAFLDFWNARDSWLPSWLQGESRISENAALQIDYVKVWKMESVEQ